MRRHSGGGGNGVEREQNLGWVGGSGPEGGGISGGGLPCILSCLNALNGAARI